jgi:hypothetical protein
MSKSSILNEASTTKSVEQIREIIFGAQMKEFDDRLLEATKHIESLQEHLTQLIQHSHNKLKSHTDRSFLLLEERLDGLEASIQQERIRQKEQSNIREIHLQKQLKAQSDLLIKKVNFMQEYVDEEKRMSEEKMHRLQHSLVEMVERSISTLADNKLSRAMMSEMFLDVAMKLQDDVMERFVEQGGEAETTS